MSDADRLKSKLDRLGSSSARRDLVTRLGTGGPEARIAFCEFLDEIILPRRAGFRTASGDALVVDIANRRLLRIETLPGTAEAPQSVIEALRPGDAEQIRAVAEAIGAFLERSGPLSVTEDPLPARPTADMLGRSAAALASALGVTLYATGDAENAPPPPRETSPALPLGEIALAMRRIGSDGQTALLAGDPDSFDGLDSLGKSSLGDAMAGVLAGEPIVTVFRRPDAERALLVRVEAAARLEVVLPADRIGPAVSAAFAPAPD